MQLNVIFTHSECSGYPDSYKNVVKNSKFPVLKNDDVDVECNPGFINNGGSKVTCIEQKDFSGDPPNCEQPGKDYCNTSDYFKSAHNYFVDLPNRQTTK